MSEGASLDAEETPKLAAWKNNSRVLCTRSLQGERHWRWFHSETGSILVQSLVWDHIPSPLKLPAQRKVYKSSGHTNHPNLHPCIPFLLEYFPGKSPVYEKRENRFPLKPTNLGILCKPYRRQIIQVTGQGPPLLQSFNPTEKPASGTPPPANRPQKFGQAS